MTNNMVMVFTVAIREHSTKALGRKIKNMGKLLKHGQMVLCIKETSLMDLKMEKVLSPGQTTVNTLGSLLKIGLKVMVSPNYDIST